MYYRVDESSRNRVWTHFDSNTPFIIMSADKAYDITDKERLDRIQNNRKDSVINK